MPCENRAIVDRSFFIVFNGWSRLRDAVACDAPASLNPSSSPVCIEAIVLFSSGICDRCFVVISVGVLEIGDMEVKRRQ